MDTMLVGGPISFGVDIIKTFNATSYSRSNGYDIDNEEARNEIANQSLLFDNVIIHAYTSNGGQLNVLYNIVNRWVEENHKGNIIVTGSIASHFDIYIPDLKRAHYSSLKTSTDKFCKIVSKKCIEGKYPFKITVIKPGMLDTERSRKKPHFIKGISGKSFCDTLKFVLNLPEDITIPEIVLENIYENS